MAYMKQVEAAVAEHDRHAVVTRCVKDGYQRLRVSDYLVKRTHRAVLNRRVREPQCSSLYRQNIY